MASDKEKETRQQTDTGSRTPMDDRQKSEAMRGKPGREAQVEKMKKNEIGNNARSEGKSESRTQEKGKSNRQGESKLEAGKSGRTTDHDTIRRWVEERGGKPATVKATEGKNDPGLLRIDFPERGDEQRLEEISWEDFFDKFEEKQLAFLYQEETRTGRVSRFSKFVSRGNDK